MSNNNSGKETLEQWTKQFIKKHRKALKRLAKL